MSRQLSTLLKMSVAGFVLMSVGACKPANKGQGALKSAGIEALNLSSADASIFGKYFQTDSCEADEMEALGALAGLGLGETGSDNVTFKARTFDAGKVTYKGFKVTDDEDVAFSAETMTFHCAQMGEDAPIFDRVDITDGLILDDDATFTFKTLSVAGPTSQAAEAVADGILGKADVKAGIIGFRGLSFTDAKIKSDAFTATISAVAWGEDRGEDLSGTADMMMGELDITHVGNNGGQEMIVDFAGLTVRNLYLGNDAMVPGDMSANGAVGQALGNLNVAQKPYDELIVGDLDMDSEGFTIDFNGIEGITTEKGDVITTKQTLSPMTVTLKPALGDNPNSKQAYDMLKALNFETLEMSASSITRLNKSEDSVAVSDGLFVIKDALRLNFEYEAEGLAAMVAKLEDLSQAGQAPTQTDAFDALKLRSMRFTLEDNSIVERGLKLASEMTGQSEKSLKRSVGMLTFGAAMAAKNELQSEVYSETAEAFGDFVKNGGTLTIEATPPAPFALAPLMTGKGDDVDPETLGFSASQENDTP